MRKVMLGLVHSIVCLMVISCGFEIPQSLTIKAKPGLRVPLGSPLKSLKEEDRVEYLVSLANIQKMMGEAGDATAQLAVYDYQMGPTEAAEFNVASNTQVYAVHYPITEMKLELYKYVQEAIADMGPGSQAYDIPPVITVEIGGILFEETPLEDFFKPAPYPGIAEIYLTKDGLQFDDTDITPSFSIPLTEMYRLVTSVTGKKFGLRISRNEENEEYDDNVKVWIPALGMAGYEDGVVSDDGEWLEFVVGDGNNSTTTFSPQDALASSAGKLEIFVKLTGPYKGNITLDMVFDWDIAMIDTSGVNGTLLEGSYPIENNFADFLGSDVEFKTINGYVYVVGEYEGFNADISLTFNGNNLIDFDPSLHLVPQRPQFAGTIQGPLLDTSLQDRLIPLTEILNTKDPVSPNLEYQFRIMEWELEKVKVLENPDEKISIDLVLVLPLELQVYSSDPASTDYAKLNLDVFPEIAGAGDLFQRGGAGDDSLFKMLTKASIILDSIDSTILEFKKFAIRVWVDENKYDKPPLDLGATKPSVTFDSKDIAFPFSPKFEFLIKKDDGKDFATLKILRPLETEEPMFDFSITVIADVDIDYPVNF